ncbi:hypothetical protein HAX54_038413 [Datura stramonium]|uniref:Uncharacterized protein n=1 Tax=Datura stramonium TaxID=4076 RepID=A0ABS8SHX6_DATST|nr:hypothetical protein [Datura stramonium]
MVRKIADQFIGQRTGQAAQGLAQGADTGAARPSATRRLFHAMSCAMHRPDKALSTVTRGNEGAFSAASRRGVLSKNFRVKLGLLTQFLCGHDIVEEEIDYRPIYDPRGIDVTKIKELQGIDGLVLFVNECNAVGPRFEDPNADDLATEDEMARVESDIESSDA